MKANKKGFTLIELLAVIVILAVIALIATPIVIGIVNDAKEQANRRSVEGYAKAVEYAYVQYMFKNDGATPTSSADYTAYIDYSGATITCGDQKFASDASGKYSVTLTNCKVDGSSKAYDYRDSKVVDAR